MTSAEHSDADQPPVSVAPEDSGKPDMGTGPIDSSVPLTPDHPGNRDDGPVGADEKERTRGAESRGEQEQPDNRPERQRSDAFQDRLDDILKLAPGGIQALSSGWQLYEQARKAQSKLTADRNRLEAELNAKSEALEEARQQNEFTRNEQIALSKFKFERNASAQRIRSVALLIVLAVVVSTPLFAMVRGVAPADFSQYMATITGLAGTVFGYWFAKTGNESEQG